MKQEKKESEEIKEEENKIVEVPVFITPDESMKINFLNNLLLREINVKLDEIIKLAKQE